MPEFFAATQNEILAKWFAIDSMASALEATAICWVFHCDILGLNKILLTLVGSSPQKEGRGN